jgi:hypothetical protein
MTASGHLQDPADLPPPQQRAVEAVWTLRGREYIECDGIRTAAIQSVSRRYLDCLQRNTVKV